MAADSGRSSGAVVTAGLGRSRAWPEMSGDGFCGAARENGTAMGGELMGESEIEALDADITRLAVEMADLATLMQQVTRDAKRLLRASGFSGPA